MKAPPDVLCELMLNEFSTQISAEKKRPSYVLEPLWYEYRNEKDPSPLDYGHDLAQKVWDTLMELDAPSNPAHRHIHQAEMQSIMFYAILRILYTAPVYNDNEAVILQKFQVPPDKTKQFVKFECPRQFGKTYAVALFATIMLVYAPHIVIGVFSPSEQQSKGVLDYVKGFLYQLYPDQEFSTQEKKITLTISDTDVRTLTAYSGSVNISFLLSSFRVVKSTKNFNVK